MAVNLRNKPVDRRRLSVADRKSYKPDMRLKAVQRANAYRGQMAMQNNNDQFRTEQKPGTGGFTQGIARQQERMRIKGQEERRAKSFRPENAISNDIYQELAT